MAFVTASCEKVDSRAPALLGNIVGLTIYGGEALSRMAKPAFVLASRRLREITVLAASELIDFSLPIRVGSIVDVHGEIVSVMRSSMRVNCQRWFEMPDVSERQLTA